MAEASGASARACESHQSKQHTPLSVAPLKADQRLMAEWPFGAHFIETPGCMRAALHNETQQFGCAAQLRARFYEKLSGPLRGFRGYFSLEPASAPNRRCRDGSAGRIESTHDRTD